jgi:hypothetical protein
MDIRLTGHKLAKYNVHDWQSGASCNGSNNRHCVEESCEVVGVAEDTL